MFDLCLKVCRLPQPFWAKVMMEISRLERDSVSSRVLGLWACILRTTLGLHTYFKPWSSNSMCFIINPLDWHPFGEILFGFHGANALTLEGRRLSRGWKSPFLTTSSLKPFRKHVYVCKPNWTKVLRWLCVKLGGRKSPVWCMSWLCLICGTKVCMFLQGRPNWEVFERKLFLLISDL